MERKALTEEYLILTTNDKGKLPMANSTETKAGLVAAGIMDLLIEGTIKIEGKKVEVVGPLPGRLNHLDGLYAYLADKTRSVTKVIEDYCMSFSSSRINQLLADTGNSLRVAGAAAEGKGGLFGNKELFVPEKVYKEALIEALKAAAVQAENLSLHDAALASLLKETRNLKQYFPKHENDLMKEKLRSIKNQQDSKIIREMVGYIDDIMTVMVAAVITTVN